MSGTQTSAFPDQNTLLSSLSGGLTASVQRNQLLNEQGRQQIGAADLDYASRLAQGVLGITDPSQRASAYTDGIQRLQAAGFAKNSPLQYPGDAAMQHVANLAIPVAQQYGLGILNVPLPDELMRLMNAPLPGGSTLPSGGGGTTGAFVPSGLPKEQFLDNVLQRESGGRNIPTQIKGPDGGPASSATGLFQIINGTWDEGKKLAGIDPSQYQQAMDAPKAVQRQVAAALYDRYGEAPWAASAPKGGGQAPAPTSAPYQVASAGATPPPPSGAAPAGTPVGDLGLVRNPDGSVGTPGGGFNGAPVQTAAADQPAPVAPPAVGAPIQHPATGLQSPQMQDSLELMRRATLIEASAPNNPRAKAIAAGLRQQAAALAQADVSQEDSRNGVHGQTNTRTNVFTPDLRRSITTRADGSVFDDQGRQIVAPLQDVRPPLGGFEVQKEDYTRDAKDLPEIAAKGQAAQSAQVRWQKMLDLVPTITSGAGGATRTKLANLAETAGFPGVAQALVANSAAGDASAAQEFTKLSLASAGAAERGDLGSRGSLGAIKLYQQSNPNMDLRPGANKAIIGMQLIAAQADADYAQAALSFGNKTATDFRANKPYIPLANFDQAWQSQRNPQVYAAAMGALNGEPTSKWAAGLNDTEYQRALDVVSRASPSAVVNGKSGRISMQPNAAAPGTAAPAAGTVQDGYRFKGGDPSQQANWEAVQ